MSLRMEKDVNAALPYEAFTGAMYGKKIANMLIPGTGQFLGFGGGWVLYPLGNGRFFQDRNNPTLDYCRGHGSDELS